MMASGENPIILEAVKRVRSGDTDAFRLIIREYKTQAFSLAYRILRNSEEAEETVQDAFLKAYKKIRQYKGESKFISWLLKIVYNLSLTRTRKKKLSTVMISEDLDIGDHNPETEINGWQDMLQADREVYIRQALEKLPTNDALVLTLFYISDNSIPEICKITGWTLSSVKVKLHRARQKLYSSLFSILKFEMKELI